MTRLPERPFTSFDLAILAAVEDLDDHEALQGIDVRTEILARIVLHAALDAKQIICVDELDNYVKEHELYIYEKEDE